MGSNGNDLSSKAKFEQSSESPRKTGSLNGAKTGASSGQLARGLAFFSIGLGMAELLVPRGVASICGISKPNTKLIRLFGAREIASGIAILNTSENPEAAVWSRVAGDAMDLACLGKAMASSTAMKGRVAFATAGVLAVTALDVMCAKGCRTENGTASDSTSRRSLIIGRSAQDLYTVWRDFERLPEFIPELRSVEITSPTRSHWKATSVGGMNLVWDSEIVEDRPNELIAWRSLPNSSVEHSGSVQFESAPANRGTLVTIEIRYVPPVGAVTAVLAKVLREDPGQIALEALRRFKQLMEVGEVTLSDGAVWNNGFWSQRPAQPLNSKELNESSDLSLPTAHRTATA
jgi:uncharacterized membrane protein